MRCNVTNVDSRAGGTSTSVHSDKRHSPVEQCAPASKQPPSLDGGLALRFCARGNYEPSSILEFSIEHALAQFVIAERNQQGVLK
jgi:hypothetical protein